jgi:tRNA(Ile2) C34 agmatinyltransferase TiaS
MMSEEVLHAERARGVIINKATIEAAKAVFVYILLLYRFNVAQYIFYDIKYTNYR